MTKWPPQTLGVLSVLGVLSQLKMSNPDCWWPGESIDTHIVRVWNKNDKVTSAHPRCPLDIMSCHTNMTSCHAILTWTTNMTSWYTNMMSCHAMLMTSCYTHLCKTDWDTTKWTSKKAWSTWTRMSNGVRRHPSCVWGCPALGVRAQKFKIWSHGTKKFRSKNSLLEVSKVPCFYFWGVLSKSSFTGIIGYFPT